MTSDRIDHAAEARRLQGGARTIVRAMKGDPALQPHMAVIIMLDDARLEAQLEIAEQLRIGNILKVDEMYLRADYEPDEEIREALGIRE
ncbi:hypothetical protein [Leucobacter sp. G161]|uniref:hypothetical protein n=1 Tax=Leucobacter sp. G161 TaxID=663704 RepID=UPI00073C438F|nr:hypothetical protein [Leucobacter sp. G161]KUF06853.1 hypothetical protein AUL38_10730 [Leucobacter sp. G161]